MNWNKPKVKVKEPASSWLLFLAGRQTAWIKNQYGVEAEICRMPEEKDRRGTPQSAQTERKQHRRFGSRLPLLAAWLH